MNLPINIDDILPECVTISSHAGLDRSILLKDLESKSFLSRRYRNRRIGEFLKELDMTEGRGTGIPKIIKALKHNQSPPPQFHSDEDRMFFAVEYPIHPAFVESEEEREKSKRPESETPVGEQVGEQVGIALQSLMNGQKSKQELLEIMSLSNAYLNYKRHIAPMLEQEFIEMSIPDKPNSPNQKYRLTAKGKMAINSKWRDKKGNKYDLLCIAEVVGGDTICNGIL